MPSTMRILAGSVLAVLWAALPGAARAQFDVEMAGAGRGSVSGQGASVVKKSPTLLRLHLLLTFKGKNVEEAIAQYRARRQTVTAELEKLGADKKSIEFGAPAVVQADSRRRQLESMIRQRLRSAGKSAKKLKLPETITLSSALTAQWPLEAKDAEEAFITAHKLQERIKALKLASGGEGKLSDEEKELMEEAGAEMEQMMSSFGEEEGDPNTPVFMYVAKISAQEKAKAMADAFQKARNNARDVARAAGADLGDLAGLTSTGGRQGGMNFNYYDDSRMSRAMRLWAQQRQQTGDEEPTEDEALGNDASQVTFNVGVMATFRLVRGAEQTGKKGKTP